MNRYLLSALASSLLIADASGAVKVNDPEVIKHFTQYPSPIPGVTTEMNYADFWISRESAPNQILLSAPEIEAYNRYNAVHTKALVNWDTFADSLSRAELIEAITYISGVENSQLQYPTEGFRYPDGRELTGDDYHHYSDNLNFEAITDVNPVRFGLVVHRELIRRFPTWDEIRGESMESAVNMFVESGAFPGEPCAVLHTSKDGGWYLIRKHDYLAWIPVEAVALGPRETVLAYSNPDQYLVVLAPQLKLEYNPEDARISERKYDMGSILPLANEIPATIGGRVPYGCFVVTVPARKTDGSLELIPALLPRSENVNLGFLPFTKGNFLRQAFAFVGERYGWGDMYNGRDCSGIVRSVYSCFGIRMARNGTEQNLQMAGQFFDFSAAKTMEEKLTLLDQLQSGDVMRMPGHTVLYLGKVGDEHFILHDTAGVRAAEGDYIPFWGVGVTPLLNLRYNGESYFERIQNAKRFSLPDAAATGQ